LEEIARRDREREREDEDDDRDEAEGEEEVLDARERGLDTGGEVSDVAAAESSARAMEIVLPEPAGSDRDDCPTSPAGDTASAAEYSFGAEDEVGDGGRAVAGEDVPSVEPSMDAEVADGPERPSPPAAGSLGLVEDSQIGGDETWGILTEIAESEPPEPNSCIIDLDESQGRDSRDAERPIGGTSSGSGSASAGSSVVTMSPPPLRPNIANAPWREPVREVVLRPRPPDGPPPCKVGGAKARPQPKNRPAPY
jgi:hypothetical protein